MMSNSLEGIIALKIMDSLWFKHLRNLCMVSKRLNSTLCNNYIALYSITVHYRYDPDHGSLSYQVRESWGLLKKHSVTLIWICVCLFQMAFRYFKIGLYWKESKLSLARFLDTFSLIPVYNKPNITGVHLLESSGRVIQIWLHLTVE